MNSRDVPKSAIPANAVNFMSQASKDDRRITIGYLIPEFPSQTHAFFWGEINAFEEAGASVIIYSTRRPASDDCPHDFAPDAIRRTTYLFPPSIGSTLTQFIKHPLRTIRAAGYIARLAETTPLNRAKLMALIPSAMTLAQNCHKAGVRHLHIHSCANSAHLGALAHILSGLPYSLTLHGDLSVYGTDHAAKMRAAAFVAAVTRPLAVQINEISPSTETPVIWMGVDCDRFRPAGRPPNQIFTVATVARLNHAKGHRFFLRAMAHLRDQGVILRYCIAGDGPEKNAIESEIAQLDLQGQVQMLGPLSEEKVLELLGQVDALALTSIGKGEAAPVAIMEAMSCGLPVICSVIGGTPDMIQNEIDGFLVKQGDVADIADRLRQLVTDAELATRIGRAARMTALARFERRANAIRLLDRIVAG